jgi:hypothetical protein
VRKPRNTAQYHKVTSAKTKSYVALAGIRSGLSRLPAERTVSEKKIRGEIIPGKEA